MMPEELMLAVKDKVLSLEEAQELFDLYLESAGEIPEQADMPEHLQLPAARLWLWTLPARETRH